MTNKTTMPEPDAYIFQHEETGQIHEVDAQQVEWGFEKNNPRLKLVGGLYSSEKMEAYADARVAVLVEALECLYGAIDSCIELTPNIMRKAETALATYYNQEGDV